MQVIPGGLLIELESGLVPRLQLVRLEQRAAALDLVPAPVLAEPVYRVEGHQGPALTVLVLVHRVIEYRSEDSHGVIGPGMATFTELAMAALDHVFVNRSQRDVMPIAQGLFNTHLVVGDGSRLEVFPGAEIILKGLAECGALNGRFALFSQRVLTQRHFTQQALSLLARLHWSDLAVSADGNALVLAVDTLLDEIGFRTLTGDPQPEALKLVIAVELLSGFTVLGIRRYDFAYMRTIETNLGHLGRTPVTQLFRALTKFMVSW